MTGNSVHQNDPRSSGSVRTFICIEVPEFIKERIDRLQQVLRAHNAKISWVKPSNIHLSLKFFGDVAATRLPAVGSAVERAVHVVRPLEIEVGGAGCFPSAKTPRVFWVGLTAVPDQLARLHALIEQELALEGFPLETRKFSPHLTIGRVRSPQNAGLVAGELMATGFAPESFQATEVIVMRSDLNPRGSIYSALYKLSLGREGCD